MTEPKPTYTIITPESEAEMTTLERAFLTRWRQFAPENTPQPVAQFHYARDIGRKLCADFAFPSARLLIECQGGVFTKQAHGSITGILKDNDRLNTAALLGWRMMRCTSKDLDEHPDKFIDQIVDALGATQLTPNFCPAPDTCPHATVHDCDHCGGKGCGDCGGSGQWVECKSAVCEREGE